VTSIGLINQEAMKIMETKTLYALLSLSAAGLFMGCGNDEPRLLTVSAAKLTAGANQPVKDAPALENAQRIRAAFANGSQAALSFGVYRLVDVGPVKGTLEARGHQLGLVGKEDPGSDQNRVGLTAGSHRLVRNEVSGSEFFADLAQHHRGQGVSRASLRPESEYVSRALAHVQQKLASQTAGANLYPYKVRVYMNAGGPNKGAPTSVEASQVAVSFNTSVDDLPVIGPGSKVAVHMAPSGEVIAHESTVRAIKERAATISGAELLSPDEAKAQVEARLVARGVKLSDYAVTREEFGYLRRGRNSVQSILAPHYAYFYEPISSAVLGKKIVETVPAVKNPAVLALITADDQAERGRKAEVLKAAPPTSRK
jgi:hypothetical protein